MRGKVYVEGCGKYGVIKVISCMMWLKSGKLKNWIEKWVGLKFCFEIFFFMWLILIKLKDYVFKIFDFEVWKWFKFMFYVYCYGIKIWNLEGMILLLLWWLVFLNVYSCFFVGL